MIPLSILDLSVVTTGTRPAAALRNSIDLAREADTLGYVRYWLAEHHNLASVASPAPDLMIGQIAAVTSRIRVGSGGVMLPNHAPLMVAERFKMLEALFPGRIDLGLGRAPGTGHRWRHRACAAQPARSPRGRRFSGAAARTDVMGDPRFPARSSLQQCGSDAR
jgi:luciferase family oxidoreductase group 1